MNIRPYITLLPYLTLPYHLPYLTVAYLTLSDLSSSYGISDRPPSCPGMLRSVPGTDRPGTVGPSRDIGAGMGYHRDGPSRGRLKHPGVGASWDAWTIPGMVRPGMLGPSRGRIIPGTLADRPGMPSVPGCKKHPGTGGSNLR